MQLFIEIAIIVLFMLCAFVAYKRNMLDFLLYSSLFALIFENLNVIFFSSSDGGYIYNGFSMYVFHVPLFVILSWGMILLSSYALSLGLKTKLKRIVAVTFFTVLVDLAIEVISVTHGFWDWISYEGVGFAQVAPSNFIGWMLVSAAFMTVYEYKKSLSFVLGYPLFLLYSVPIVTVYNLFSLSGVKGYYIVVVLCLVLGFYTLKNYKIPEDFSLVIFRYPFYLYSLLFLSHLSLLSLSVLLVVVLLEMYLIIKLIKSVNTLNKR